MMRIKRARPESQTRRSSTFGNEIDRCRVRLGERMRVSNRVRRKDHQLLGRLNKGDVGKPALHLGPFTPHDRVEMPSVLVEGLVQYADHEQWLIAASAGMLGQFLEQEQVGVGRMA